MWTNVNALVYAARDQPVRTRLEALVAHDHAAPVILSMPFLSSVVVSISYIYQLSCVVFLTFDQPTFF